MRSKELFAMAFLATGLAPLVTVFPSLRRLIMSQWKVDVIQIAQARDTKQLWKWVLFPPLDVLRECLRDRHCTSCHGAVGPFLFIGKLPNGPYMAFRRPIQLVRNGTLGLVIQPVVEPAKTPEPQPPPKKDLPETPLYQPRRPRIMRVVDLPKSRTKKAAKKTAATAPKKPSKKPMKKVAKKTPRRRRTP